MHETLVTFPLTDPVLVLATALSIVLLVPMLFERLRLPGLVGLILAGILIGPYGLNVIARDQSIVLLSTAGLLYVMFIAGLEIDLATFRQHRTQSLVFGILCFLIPGGLGVATGWLLGFSWPAAFMLGAVIAPHTLLAYPLVSRMGLAKRTAITAAVGGTILTDVLALMALTVVAGGTAGSLDAWFWLRTIGSMALFGTLVIWGVPQIGNWFFKSASLSRDQETAFVLAVLFVAGAGAKLLDIEPIVGAFLAGLTLNHFIPEPSSLMVRVQSFGNAVFIPFFLLATGMLVNPRALAGDGRAWVIAGAILAAAIVGKWLANWLTGLWFGYSRAERWTMFGLTVSHAAATLAVALTGLKLGLFGPDTINGIIVMMLGTCLLAAFTVQRFGSVLALEEAATPAVTLDGPERILVPMVNPKNAEPLMDLAMLVRPPGGQSPIVPLTIVQPANRDVAVDVAKAEKLLARAVIHAASADLPVQPVVRVSLNVANGIKQAATDTSSSLLIMAWNGERSLKELAFGSVIDQVLTRSTVMLLLAHFAGPLNITRRVIAILPPLIEGHPGFRKLMHTLQRLVSHLGADLLIWEVETSPQAWADAFLNRLTGASEREMIRSWRELTQRLTAEVGHDDLVVFLCARDESYMMPQTLDKLPRLLSQRLDRNFLVLYAPELGETAEPVANEPKALQPRHAAFPLEVGSTEEALAVLFDRSFVHFTDRPLPDTAPTLQSNWLEVVPGAVIAGVRLREWPEMTVAIGVCESGLHHPGSAAPIQVVLLCLTPADMPLAEQTAYLQWIGRQVTKPGILQYLGQFPQSEAVAEILSMA